MTDIWQNLATLPLPLPKLEAIYRHAKSRSVTTPIERQLTARGSVLHVHVPNVGMERIRTTAVRSAKGRPSLHTFFRDPRDMIRLREMVEAKRTEAKA